MSTEMLSPESLAQQGWKHRELPGYMGRIGPLWTRRDGESWTYGLLVDHWHLNPAGVVHGGALSALLDHALATIAWEAVQRIPCVTVQMSVQYLAPASLGQFIAVHGRVVRATSSLLFLNGEACVGETIVAQASAVLKVAGKVQSA